EHRSRERVLDRLAFERVGAARAERLVRLYEQHARADTLEKDEAPAAAGTAIEADVVRSQAGRESRREQELGVHLRDLEEHRSGPLVPVQREVAVNFPHAGGAILDRRCRAAASALP